ncbi:MAG TPA: alpha/beta hydrolase-fold protein [Verrucomicrobiae bacterium]|nr:alpha/beta hydrolase-fold protein [Verrucomicrobiae bacterium]
MKITSACWLLMLGAGPVVWAQNPAAAPAASPPAAADAKPDASGGTNRNQRFGRDPAMDAFYKLGPDSQPQEGVPKGRIDGPKVIRSEVFPGTQHTYWVYVPAQYDPARPSALMVFNDGQAFKNEPGDVQAHHVLDNLIYRREIPVMLAVFINPGRRPDQPEPTPQNWGDRDTNRPEEYNALNDKYPRVIVDELLPVLNRDYNLSKDPEQHGIGGASSGGIAAFTVAWHRPDHFRKVFTFVGSFVNLGNRQGHTYPDIVLQNDKKPLRVFLQDGRNDNRGGVRRDAADPDSYDWFYQNVRLAHALTRKGYDVNYTWGIGNHGQKQGGAIFPEIMRWLWRDAQAVSTDRSNAVERAFRPTFGTSSNTPAPPRP